jgi:N-acetylneuraminic acid mutarotase
MNGYWQTRKPMPELRYQGCGAVALEGHIYVFGGWEDHVNGDGLPHPDVFVYDPRHNSWRRSVKVADVR